MDEGLGAGRASASRSRTDSGDGADGPGEPSQPQQRTRIVRLIGIGALVAASPAAAETLPGQIGAAVSPVDLLYLACLAMLIGTAMLTAVFLMRQRAAIAAENDDLRARLAETRTDAEARLALLSAGGERLLVYSGPGDPEVLGALPDVAGVPAEERRFLAFGDWMSADRAAELEAAIGRLRGDAEAFRMEIDLPDDGLIEASGRTLGGLAVVRFTGLDGVREALHRLEVSERMAQATIETMQNLFDAAPIPIWLRDASNNLVWVNSAYATAVDAQSVGDGLARQIEFLSEHDRAADRRPARRRRRLHRQALDRRRGRPPTVRGGRGGRPPRLGGARHRRLGDRAGPHGAAPDDREPVGDARPAQDRRRALRREDPPHLLQRRNAAAVRPLQRLSGDRAGPPVAARPPAHPRHPAHRKAVPERDPRRGSRRLPGDRADRDDVAPVGRADAAGHRDAAAARRRDLDLRGHH